MLSVGTMLNINAQADSIVSKPNASTTLQQVLPVVVPSLSLFGLATIVRPFDRDIRTWRNDHFENYSTSADNFVQVLPGVTAYGLRLAGIKGKSKTWGQMLTSTAVSGMFAITFAEGIKNTIGRTRPNSPFKRNSFPSGHTLSAFCSATILSEEYKSLSPWYSIGGYTTASLVGVSRVLNNRHWASDVLAGAGFGILSGKLGYAIGDCLFNKTTKDRFDFKKQHPNFIGISGAYNWGGKHISTNELRFLRFDHSAGFGYCVEGAYYPFKHWGIGCEMNHLYGRYKIDQDWLKASNIHEKTFYNNYDGKFESSLYQLTPAIYGCTALSSYILIGAKAGFGLSGAHTYNVEADYADDMGWADHRTICYDEYDFGTHLEGGVFCQLSISSNLGLHASVNYTYTNTKYNFALQTPAEDPIQNITAKVGINLLFDK